MNIPQDIIDAINAGKRIQCPSPTILGEWVDVENPMGLTGHEMSECRVKPETIVVYGCCFPETAGLGDFATLEDARSRANHLCIGIYKYTVTDGKPSIEIVE